MESVHRPIARPSPGGARPRARSAIAGLLLCGVWAAGLAAPGPCAAEASSARTSGAPTASEEPSPAAEAGGGDLEARLAVLEKQVAALRQEVERLRAAGAGEASGAELERRIDALSREIERLRLGEVAAPVADRGTAGLGPAASKVYRSRGGVSIGGYGTMTYTDPAAHADDGAPSDRTATADLRRVVLYFGYRFDDHLLFDSEVEFEHAVAGEGEDGEVEVEFAFVDYRKSERFGARGGLLLIPVGFLNEQHEPPTFFGVDRPLVEQDILPTTWRELGGGVYGECGPLAWKAYLVNSLDASGFGAAEGIREGRQEGAQATFEDAALTARLDWTPVQGLVLGASLFTGDTAQATPGLDGARLRTWDAHAAWRWRGLRARALLARTHLDDAGDVSALVGEVIGGRQAGYYVEAGWDVLHGRSGGAELSPFARYEALDTQAGVPAGLARDPANDRRVLTVGVHYRPIPNLALKVDWQDVGNAAGTGVDQVSLGLGWMF